MFWKSLQLKLILVFLVWILTMLLGVGVFSIYKIEEESYYITTKFKTDIDYQNFLDTIKGRSIHNFDTNLTINDKVLTLSTCYSDTERTVVHAKLIKRNKK